MKDHKTRVLLTYPNAAIISHTDWIYITKDKNVFLDVSNVAGKGKTEQTAWKSAAKGFDKNEERCIV